LPEKRKEKMAPEHFDTASPTFLGTLIAPVRQLSLMHLITTIAVQLLGTFQLVALLLELVAAANDGSSRVSAVILRHLPAVLYAAYLVFIVASVVQRRGCGQGPSIGDAAVSRCLLLSGWLAWQAVVGNAIMPLAEVEEHSAHAALVGGAAAVETLATVAVILALLQDAHVLFDFVGS
jgi:hypothetical protein